MIPSTRSFPGLFVVASLSVVLVSPLARPLAAQGRRAPTQPALPAHLMPPAGKCRIWMEGVPPAQQPAPTDCQTALRQKPSNGTVIFGPTVRQEAARGFRPTARPASRDTVKRDTTPPRATPARAPTPTKATSRRDTTRPPVRRPARPDSSGRPS